MFFYDDPKLVLFSDQPLAAGCGHPLHLWIDWHVTLSNWGMWGHRGMLQQHLWVSGGRRRRLLDLNMSGNEAAEAERPAREAEPESEIYWGTE